MASIKRREDGQWRARYRDAAGKEHARHFARKVDGHYFASLLIASGADVKVVQKRLRHASAMTTLNTYVHMWPDADESARAAVAVVLAARADSRAKRLAD